MFKNSIAKLSFFVFEERMETIMINEIRQEINLSPELEIKIKWVIQYPCVKVKLQKGALIRLEPTNLAYVQPHRIEINGYTFL
jgi:hypothetical protein